MFNKNMPRQEDNDCFADNSINMKFIPEKRKIRDLYLP